MSLSADAPRRILVVDDDRALRHALSTLLEEAGHIVLQASDGPEALARLAGGPTDLMLLDLGLPGMGGHGSARARPRARRRRRAWWSSPRTTPRRPCWKPSAARWMAT